MVLDGRQMQMPPPVQLQLPAYLRVRDRAVHAVLHAGGGADPPGGGRLPGYHRVPLHPARGPRLHRHRVPRHPLISHTPAIRPRPFLIGMQIHWTMVVTPPVGGWLDVS
eukprot:EG_transcript_5065